MTFPLRTKLTLVYSALFLSCAAVLEIGTYWGVKSALDSMLERELISHRAVVEEYVHNHVSRLSWDSLRTAIAEHRGFQPEWIAIEDLHGNRLFAGARLSGALANPSLAPTRVLRETRRIHGTDYIFLTGMDSAIPSAVLDRLRALMLISAPLLLLLASAIGYWIAGRALRPVQRISDAARSINAHNLATRLEVPDSGDELQGLAETINHMLDRIEAGFRHMSHFTANASHELRTPVAIIRSTAEVALLHPSPSETPERKALRRILRQSERNSQLLDDMLRLARLDSGAEPTRRESVDLCRSVREAASACLALCEKQGLQLHAGPSSLPSPSIIEGDDAQLRRLWTILLDNAMKYTPRGGRIDLQVEPDGVCTIRDSGCGIAPEHLPHIFERFYRADKARVSGGFGLGLSLARQITDAHGATIEAESTPGQGTMFRIRFEKVISHNEIQNSGDSQVHNIALQ